MNWRRLLAMLVLFLPSFCVLLTRMMSSGVLCCLLILNINIIVSAAAYCAVSIVSDISRHK